MTMNLKTTLALVAMTFVFAFSGCQNKETERKEPLDESYKLIDRGSYSEAIQNLQDLSVTDKRPQVLVALGSAYAARGGIKVAQYWGFVVGFKAPLVKDENKQVKDTVKGLQHNLNDKDADALGGILRTLAVWDDYKERIDAIPVVSGEALKDLGRAVDVLEQVHTPGGRLYRAILNLILFKSYIAASQGVWDEFNAAIGDVLNGNTEVLCKYDFRVFMKWLSPISYHLMETMKDLTIAFPDKEADFVSARNLAQAVYSTTKDAIQDLRDQKVCK
jgi:hypothetical protein